MYTHQIDINGKQINFSDQGKGPTLVLLHGFLESLEVWRDFADKLSKRFRVIAIDLPGHGQSAVFSDEHSMAFMAEAVKRVLDHLHVVHCLLVGHSMGGYVSLAFAQHYPNLIKGLVLFHSQAAPDTEDAKKNRLRTIQVIENDRVGFISSFVPDLFSTTQVGKYTPTIKWLKAIAQNTPKMGITAALKGMMNRQDSRKLLENLSIPILIIAGKDDKRIPVDQISAQATLPNHCELLVLGGVGHMGIIEAPEITCGVIESFANRIFTD